MDNYIVIHRAELTPDEAEKAPRGEVDLRVVMHHRPVTCLAVIPEKEFAAVAGLHAIPNPPDSATERTPE